MENQATFRETVLLRLNNARGTTGMHPGPMMMMWHVEDDAIIGVSVHAMIRTIRLIHARR